MPRSGDTRLTCLPGALIAVAFVAPELSTDGTSFSLNSLFQRISFAAHSMSTAEAGVQARLHALIDFSAKFPSIVIQNT